jgi:hypothetical protein
VRSIETTHRNHHRTLGTILAVVALLALVATTLPGVAAAAGKGKRYGIEGKFVAYDQAAQTMKVFITSNKASGFGGSTVGGKAPKDVKVREERLFSVRPEGSVLSRTVIKSSKGTGLDNSGTQDGFSKAVKAIPNDRVLAFSIEKNAGGGPDYKIKTIVLKLTDEEIRQRFEEITVDD